MTLTGLPELVDAPAPSSELWDLDVLGAADWQELRATRLRALGDSPHAFVATYAAEATLPEAYWRGRIESSTWMVARIDGEAIGLARLRRPEDEPPEVRYVESVWVDPVHRCKGVVRSMLEELESYALKKDVSHLRLWVLDTNESARDAYLKLDFSPELGADDVNRTKKTVAGKPVMERRMIKAAAALRSRSSAGRLPTD